MQKTVLDLTVKSCEMISAQYALLKLTQENSLPEMHAGQFVEVRVDNSSTTFLRRPISINFIDRNDNTLWLLIQVIGDGTRSMSMLQIGDIVNVILPLGNGFSWPKEKSKPILLVGGGVGTAPMLYWGKLLKDKGYEPNFLLGARSKKDLLQLADFSTFGSVYTTTEDGSYGEKGYVTNHSALNEKPWQRVYVCGPKPMMMAVAKEAKRLGVGCEVSLENNMACGVGACLCCVEDTKKGHVCVCTDGPVFDVEKLKW